MTLNLVSYEGRIYFVSFISFTEAMIQQFFQYIRFNIHIDYNVMFIRVVIKSICFMIAEVSLKRLFDSYPEE